MPDDRRLCKEELARRGDDVYRRVVAPQVENVHRGRIVAIDVQSEEFELGDSVLEASERLSARVSNAEVWAVRVGYPAVYRI